MILKMLMLLKDLNMLILKDKILLLYNYIEAIYFLQAIMKIEGYTDIIQESDKSFIELLIKIKLLLLYPIQVLLLL